TTRPHYCRKAPNPNSDQRKKRRRKTGTGRPPTREATARFVPRQRAKSTPKQRYASGRIRNCSFGKGQSAKGKARLPDHGTTRLRRANAEHRAMLPCGNLKIGFITGELA